jgi:hypothetical protein
LLETSPGARVCVSDIAVGTIAIAVPGRPAGKKYSETIPARLEPATLISFDAWAAANDMSRSEAIRRLVELGLKVKGK